MGMVTKEQYEYAKKMLPPLKERKNILEERKPGLMIHKRDALEHTNIMGLIACYNTDVKVYIRFKEEK